jgi:hypothetical protein
MNVFATWLIKATLEDLLESMEGVYISCGSGDIQMDGFHPDEGRVTIESLGDSGDGRKKWKVTLTCPSEDIEKQPDYWLSPSEVVGAYDKFWHKKTGEAIDFGVEA